MSTPTDSPLLMHLREHDAPCPACGYNLRGITTLVCPECGLKLTIGVALADAPTRLWTAGVVLAALGAGFHGLLGLWIGSMMVGRRGGPPWHEFLPLPVGFMLCAGALWLLLTRRPAFLRCSRRWAFWLMIATGLAGLVPFVWLVSTVR